MSRVWTAIGNAQIDTADYKFGGGSLLLDGTLDCVQTPGASDLNLNSGPWAAESRFKCNAAGGTQLILFGQADAAVTAASSSIWVERHTTNVMRGFAFVDGTAFVVTGTTQFTNAVNTGWHHVRFIRTGNILRLFIDGVQEGGDIAITGSVNASTSKFAVGALGELNASQWNGWIDEFRLSIGDPRSIANFTPEVMAFATDPATRILLHFDGADASTLIVDSFDLAFIPAATFRPFSEAMRQAIRDQRGLALLAEIEHPNGTARFWTGIGTLVWDGFNFVGAGRLGSVSPVRRTSDISIQEVVFSLSGVLPEEAAELSEDVRNRIGRVWLICIGEYGEVIEEPYQLLEASLDFQSFNASEDGETILSITAYTGFYSLERALQELWTAENQKFFYPTDTGLDMIASLQNQDVQWTPT